jgi:hypothetical protein
MNADRLEKLLQKAPSVRTPPALLQDLQSEIVLPRDASRSTRRDSLDRAWFRRWVPALGFALWFLGCVVVLGIQASRIAEVREQKRVLASAKMSAEQQALAAETPATTSSNEIEQLKKDLADVQRLRTETEQLRLELAELPKIRMENDQLRAGLKPPVITEPAPEQDFFSFQADRATKVKCVHNLKQVGLAARLWAKDNGDVLAPSFEAMKAELNTDKVTFCPSDGTTRYELLSPGASQAEPQIVYTCCPVHQNVGLADGSVQMLRENQKVVQRDGKWVIGQ